MIRIPPFVTDPAARITLDSSKDFDPTSKSIEPRTVIDCFRDTVRKHPSRAALLWKDAHEKSFKEKNYQQYYDNCISFAKALINMQMDVFNVVNIIGFNSPEWFIANTGTILAGCISAGIYTTNSPEACQYCSDHGQAKVVIMEGNKQLAKYAEVAHNIPSLIAIVVWGETIDQTILAQIPGNIRVYSWDEFIIQGAELDDSQVEVRWAYITPGNCASLIYTSGTTGPPKAVMISHDNLTWTANQICNGGYMVLNQYDTIISYLPLSHIAAQLIDLHCMMMLGAAVYFAQHDALKGSLITTMKEVRPTFFFAVPRVWEKMQAKLKQVYRSSNYLVQMLHKASTTIGLARSVNKQIEGNNSDPWGYFLANKLYLQRVKEAIGLDQCKGCFTAAAPISPDTLWYFAALDIPVYEVFGQSECTGPHTISAEGHWKIGYCGRPLVGTETKIVPETGELCYRGRHIFMGYMHMPKETEEAFDENGFLRSGDIAEIHPTGLLRIVGRIKDLIVTAGGENVSPSLIENAIKNELDVISNCIVIGDHRRFLSMLISLQVDNDSSTGKTTDVLSHATQELGKQLGSNATTYTEAKNDPKWEQYVNDGIARVNKKAQSNAQKIQKWQWLPHELSEQTGETTATQKVKRNVVIQNHQDLIDEMYRDT